ncbi:hypothetical protein [Streptosporangium subroseum]|uniref:hypothetical protein n=1 Tax=Streptosporangium subroseum TaxID=106412 RepID=UPI00308BCEB4|nr:hypothetical protein OHB15_14045 [Streptosporangium subroseum]
MTQHSPALRFGIEISSQRSHTWRVRSGARKPELYVERENLAKQAHISLHESGQWHLKVDGKPVILWQRPVEITQGYTRALVIVQPVSIASILLPAPNGSQLIKVADDAMPTHFNLFIERPGADLASWPARISKGTVLVGRIPLANGAGWCCVVANQEPLAPGSARFNRPGAEVVEQMRDAAEAGTLHGTIFGPQSDGTMTFIDGRIDNSTSLGKG